MSTATIIGLDLAKNIFQIHGVDEHGKTVLRKRVKRHNLLNFFAKIPSAIIGIEACGGANHWARELTALGHTVRQMSPQFVKPYVKTNKNDANDAEGICEAVSRPNMRFVQNKNMEQTDAQYLIRVRSQLIRERTALVNQARGFLLEYDITIEKGIGYFRKTVPWLLENSNNSLSPIMRGILSDRYTRLVEIDEKIDQYDAQIKEINKSNELCRRLLQIPKIGDITAMALLSAIGDASNFKSGRHLSAWLGLVPKQKSSGHKRVLLGISKRGNTALRSLLVQGAHNVLRYCDNKKDRVSLWAQELKKRKGAQVASVAIANKMARFAWAVLTKKTAYDPNHVMVANAR